jgi:hypothetical protein
MDDNLLASDYQFVREVDREVDSSKRMMNKSFGGHVRYARTRRRGQDRVSRGKSKCGESAASSPGKNKVIRKVGDEGNIIPRKLSPKMYHFSREAKSRGVDLRLMPFGMQRRRQNSSMYNKKSDTLYWRLEFVFSLAQHGELRHVERKVADNLSLNDILSKLLTTGDASDGLAPMRYRLKAYCLAEKKSELAVLMMRVDSPANGREWHALDKDRPLREIFKGKTIVEFPTLHVAIPSESKNFALVDDGPPPPPRQSLPPNVS